MSRYISFRDFDWVLFIFVLPICVRRGALQIFFLGSRGWLRFLIEELPDLLGQRSHVDRLCEVTVEPSRQHSFTVTVHRVGRKFLHSAISYLEDAQKLDQDNEGG